MQIKENPRQKSGQAKIEKKWTVLLKEPIKEVSDIPAPFLKVLINRGVIVKKDLSNDKVLKEKIDSFLNPNYEKELGDPFLLPDMGKAVSRIIKALEEKEKIAIYGDYDVDGTTASTLLGDLLRKLMVDFMIYVPSRHEEGYGLNKKALDGLKKEGVSLIITVDCGIKSFEEVEYSNKIGLDIIITDHHELQKNQKSKIKNQKSNPKFKKIEDQQIPNAIAVINPKRSDSKYPFRELAGVGVAFKLACGILEELEKKNKLKKLGLSKDYSKWLLDLVMIGTICDIVPLSGENRTLCHFGFKVLGKRKRPGLTALINISGNEGRILTSHNIGFHLGPRLNASGRLEHANLSLDLLNSEDKNEARKLAVKINELNEKRQLITARILEEARGYLNDTLNKKIVLLKNKNWPKGVIGIVASRLMDECGKPVILFEETDGLLEGSARSIKNFNIIEALAEASDILIKYGGHKKAAGLSLKNSHFILLEKKLLKIAEDRITEKDLIAEIIIDTVLKISDINSQFYSLLKKMEPFGFGNEMPKFIIKGLIAKEIRKVGKDGSHLKMVFEDDDKKGIGGIFFGGNDKINLKVGEKADVVFTIVENEWMDRKSLEIRVIDMIAVS